MRNGIFGSLLPDFARRSFYFLGASIFNSLPLSLRNINSRILFWKALDDHYL